MLDIGFKVEASDAGQRIVSVIASFNLTVWRDGEAGEEARETNNTKQDEHGDRMAMDMGGEDGVQENADGGTG